MDDLGLKLKRAREAEGVSLKDIALRTKISVTALEALERNDLTKLPGGIFGRAFVRSYALEIGLDPDTIVQEFMGRLTESEREAAERNRVRVEVTADDREFLERQRQAIRWLRVGVVGVAILSVSFLGWRLKSFWSKRAAAADAAAHIAAPAAPVALPDVTPPPAAAGDLPAPLNPPELPAAPASALAINLSATSDCWIFVMADGKTVNNEMLRAGQSKAIDADRDIVLDLSSAAAVTWTLNGQPGKVLGKPGEHVRVRIVPSTQASFLQTAQ